MRTCSYRVFAWRHLVLLGWLVAGSAWSQARNEVAFYIAAYGEVTATASPLAARAHRVFERVRAVADKNAKRLPHLVVIDGPGDPWAIALPSGHVVLSLRAAEICAAHEAIVDACLAFVLGHELAHLAHEDFWHREVHAFLASSPTSAPGPSTVLAGGRTAAARELAADDQGFVYAALAGFAVDTLVTDSGEAGGFFVEWAKQSQARLDARDATPAERARILSRRLEKLMGRIDFFDYGVRLTHFGYCDDAVYFFREFQKVYPGREVLNNLGHCYVQLARQHMPPEHALFYWLPSTLDVHTRAGALRERGATTIRSLSTSGQGRARGYLLRAVELLEQATAADPGYVPAAVNLAVAQLYLGRPHRARAALGDIAPTDRNTALQRAVLEALILYEQSEADTDLWAAAVKRLERLAEEYDAPIVWFNLARLLEVRARTGAAQEFWRRLTLSDRSLPAPVRAIVCARRVVGADAVCSSSRRTNTPPPGNWPIADIRMQTAAAGTDWLESNDWKSAGFDWYADQLSGRILSSRDRSASILVIDDFVQMQVLRNNTAISARQLEARCTGALSWRELAPARVATCGNWAALIDGEQVRELWWLAR